MLTSGTYPDLKYHLELRVDLQDPPHDVHLLLLTFDYAIGSS
jgi:hypothetical protein